MFDFLNFLCLMQKHTVSNHVYNHPTPNHKWGGGFKARWRDPIIAPLKYIPIKQAISGLSFFMWLNFYFCLTLES